MDITAPETTNLNKLVSGIHNSPSKIN